MAGAGKDHHAFRGVDRGDRLIVKKDNGGGGHSLDGRSSFFADCPEAMQEHFVPDRVESGSSHAAFPFRQRGSARTSRKRRKSTSSPAEISLVARPSCLAICTTFSTALGLTSPSQPNVR